MIKVTIGFRLIMQRRRIAVLDSFFDRITMLLWPRSVGPFCSTDHKKLRLSVLIFLGLSPDD